MTQGLDLMNMGWDESFKFCNSLRKLMILKELLQAVVAYVLLALWLCIYRGRREGDKHGKDQPLNMDLKAKSKN